MKKIKVGLVLLLVGIGIPLTLMFFQTDGELFKLTIEKQDKLREAEVETLNGLVDINRLLNALDSPPVKQYAEKVMNEMKADKDSSLYNGWVIALYSGVSIDQVKDSIQSLLNKAFIPNTGRILDYTTVKSTEVDKLREQYHIGRFIMDTPTDIKVGIPYKYSIGLGTIIFLVGFGLVLVATVDRQTSKIRKQSKKEEEK